MAGEHQPAFEGMTDREILEGMNPDQIVDVILANGEIVTRIESHMNLASDVLEGAYGLTVEQVLEKREGNTNGKAETTSP